MSTGRRQPRSRASRCPGAGTSPSGRWPSAAASLRVLREQIRDFQPDWVLVSSEDLGHVLLRAASQEAPGRIVYLAHTPQFFPFGPASWNPDGEGKDLVTRAAAVVAIGHHTAGYIRRHTGRAAAVIHPPIYGAGPFENFGSFERGLITIVNPCAVKGISVFLALADSLPQYEFGALPGWGTTSADRKELEGRANVRAAAELQTDSASDGADAAAADALALVRGFRTERDGGHAARHSRDRERRRRPCRSQDGHAFRGAGAGNRALPPIFDERGMPQPEIEPTPIDPWTDAVRALLTDRALYEGRVGEIADGRARVSSARLDARQAGRTAAVACAAQGAAASHDGKPLARKARAAAAAAAQERGAEDQSDADSAGAKLALLSRRTAAATNRTAC